MHGQILDGQQDPEEAKPASPLTKRVTPCPARTRMDHSYTHLQHQVIFLNSIVEYAVMLGRRCRNQSIEKHRIDSSRCHQTKPNFISMASHGDFAVPIVIILWYEIHECIRNCPLTCMHSRIVKPTLSALQYVDKGS